MPKLKQPWYNAPSIPPTVAKEHQRRVERKQKIRLEALTELYGDLTVTKEEKTL